MGLRMTDYSPSIVGLALICLVPVILANIVGPVKGKAQGVGGPVADARDDNPLFRLERTHGNSVEAVPVFVLSAILGMMAGIGVTLLGWLVWVFLAARLAYAVVYLRGGPLGRGGSLRTIIYLVGSLANIVLIVATVLAAL
jgi:uncharacterized MAPEG superfamily protein